MWGNQPRSEEPAACWFSLLSTACPELCQLLFSRGRDKLQMESMGVYSQNQERSAKPPGLLGENR